MNTCRRGSVLAVGVLTWWACLAASASASQIVPEPDPVTCWWRSNRAAIHVGEQFTLTLTCGVVEDERTRTVVDPDRLAPESLDLAPFEVLAGTAPEDVQAPPGRYFQRSYTLRVIGDEFFGQDIEIPSVGLTYRVDTLGATGSRGRDRVYVLPTLPIRVHSLVPRDVEDIQDWSPDTFGDMERRRFRANVALSGAGILFVFAAVFAGAAAVRALRPAAARVATAPRGVPLSRVLQEAVREAQRVQAEAGRSGWTSELVGRALTVLRIGASVATGRPLAQRVLAKGGRAQDGELEVNADAFGARRAAVSGSGTAAAAGTDPSLDALGEALRVFTAARYGRPADLDGSTLDAAFTGARRVLADVLDRHGWRTRAVQAMSGAASGARDRVWRR